VRLTRGSRYPQVALPVVPTARSSPLERLNSKNAMPASGAPPREAHEVFLAIFAFFAAFALQFCQPRTQASASSVKPAASVAPEWRFLARSDTTHWEGPNNGGAILVEIAYATVQQQWDGLKHGPTRPRAKP